MTISVYTMLEAGSPSALNTLVAAAIADGQQPFGQPGSRIMPHGETGFFQAMITGAQVLVGAPGDAGADYTTALDTDATMAANSDAKLATQKATKTGLATKAASTVLSGALDVDATMAANSDAKVPSQKAVKTALATKQATITPAAFVDGATGTVANVCTALIAAGLMAAS